MSQTSLRISTFKSLQRRPKALSTRRSAKPSTADRQKKQVSKNSLPRVQNLGLNFIVLHSNDTILTLARCDSQSPHCQMFDPNQTTRSALICLSKPENPVVHAVMVYGVRCTPSIGYSDNVRLCTMSPPHVHIPSANVRTLAKSRGQPQLPVLRLFQFGRKFTGVVLSTCPGDARSDSEAQGGSVRRAIAHMASVNTWGVHLVNLRPRVVL